MLTAVDCTSAVGKSPVAFPKFKPVCIYFAAMRALGLCTAHGFNSGSVFRSGLGWEKYKVLLAPEASQSQSYGWIRQH